MRTDALLAASFACILCELGATLLGRTEGPDGLPGVETHPDLTFFYNAVKARLISIALPLVAVQVVPTSKFMMAEPTREPGARLLPREPLLEARLPVAAELHGGLPEGPRVSISPHAVCY